MYHRLPTLPGVFLEALQRMAGASYAQAEALASAAPTGIQLGITVHTGHRKLLLTVAESPDQLLPDFVCDMFQCHHILRAVHVRIS
jgi:hypothetical protein